MLKKCSQCEIEFKTILSKTSKYCSRECYNKSCRIDYKRNCLNCQTEYLIRDSNKKRKFCTVRCANKYRRGKTNEYIKFILNHELLTEYGHLAYQDPFTKRDTTKLDNIVNGIADENFKKAQKIYTDNFENNQIPIKEKETPKISDLLPIGIMNRDLTKEVH